MYGPVLLLILLHINVVVCVEHFYSNGVEISESSSISSNGSECRDAKRQKISGNVRNFGKFLESVHPFASLPEWSRNN